MAEDSLTSFILQIPDPSCGTPTGKRTNAYVALGIAGISATLLGTAVLLSPSSVGAFWPFSAANAADGDAPVLHDPSLNLLEAAVNSDPNPSKDGDGIPVSEGSALMNISGPEDSTSESVQGASRKASASTSGGGSITEYTVREGDSVSTIAKKFGVSVNTILWTNDLGGKGTIRPGDELIILPVSGTKHTVKSGDTLSSIAKKYDADADEIASFNDVGASLVAGTQLIIPGGELTAAPVTKKAATKTTTTKPAATTKAKTTASSSGNFSGYFGNPLPGGKLSQGIHGYNGVDVTSPNGTPIYAAAAGTVLISSDGYNGGYGNYVVIKHDNGMQTLYGHMSRRATEAGATVGKGDLIGYVGSTGRSTGNHLHFEVRGGKNPYSQ